MGIKKKKNSPRMERTLLLLLLLYNRGSGVYQPSVIPSIATTVPNDDRLGEGPSDKNRKCDAPRAVVNKG